MLPAAVHAIAPGIALSLKGIFAFVGMCLKQTGARNLSWAKPALGLREPEGKAQARGFRNFGSATVAMAGIGSEETEECDEREQCDHVQCRLLGNLRNELDLEAQPEMAAELPDTPQPSSQPGRASNIGLISMAVTAMAAVFATLFLIVWTVWNDEQDEQAGPSHLRMLAAVGGGSAIGSCWLKCGAAVGKGIHTAGTFIGRFFISAGQCIHSIFSSVNQGFGDCCSTVGHQLEKCHCSHCWMASGKCIGGCCTAFGNLINGIFVIFGSTISSCCDVFANFFSSSWNSCGYFLNDICPF